MKTKREIKEKLNSMFNEENNELMSKFLNSEIDSKKFETEVYSLICKRDALLWVLDE